MSRTITLGEFPDDANWVDRLVLPHVAAVPAYSLLSDGLGFALTHRTGIALLGWKGAGKTYGRHRVVDAFEARERRRADADALYQPQRLVVLTTVRAQRPEDVYVKLWQAMLGESPELRVRGRRKREDELRTEFVYLAYEERVAALVIDEGEMSRSVVLDVARDLMSEAEDFARTRAGDGARDRAGAYGAGAYGLGVVLIGTPALGGRLSASAEKGQRWAKTVDVPAPDASIVPDVYAGWFAGFAPAIRAMGEPAWRAFVQTTVVRDRPVAMKLLARHAREYTRVTAAQDRTVRRLQDVPFDRDVFRLTFDELDAGNSRGERG